MPSSRPSSSELGSASQPCSTKLRGSRRVYWWGVVEVAVVCGAQDRVAVVVDDLGDVHGDVVTDDLLGDEAPDRVDSADLAVSVVDVGVLGEGGHDRVGVERIDGRDVISDHAGEWGGGRCRPEREPPVL